MFCDSTRVARVAGAGCLRVVRARAAHLIDRCLSDFDGDRWTWPAVLAGVVVAVGGLLIIVGLAAAAAL